MTAAGIAGAFVLLLGGLWLSQDSVAPPPRGAQPAAAAPPQASAPAGTPQTGIEVERSFMDAPSAAHVAYAAGDMTAALRQYEEALASNPSDPETLSNLGQVLVRLNRAADALPYFERAIAILPDKWAYQFNHARALGVLGRWNEAVASYRRAQELFPDDYATAFNLGLALDPNEPTFRMALGMTYERLQQPSEAAAAYEEAVRLAPQAPDAAMVRRKIDQLRGATPAAPAAAPGAAQPPVRG